MILTQMALFLRFVRSDLPGSTGSSLFFGIAEEGTRSTQVCSAAFVADWYVHAMVQEIDLEGYPAIRFVTHWKRNDEVKIYRSDFKGYTRFQYREGSYLRPDWGWTNSDVSNHRHEFVEEYYVPKPAFDWYTMGQKVKKTRSSFHEVYYAKFPKQAWPTTRSAATANYAYFNYDVRESTKRDTAWETVLQNKIGISQPNNLGGYPIAWNSQFCNMIDDVHSVDRLWRKKLFYMFWVQALTDSQEVQIRILPNLKVQDTETHEQYFVEEVQLLTVDGKQRLEISFRINLKTFRLTLF
jgi:hypothetical protein